MRVQSFTLACLLTAVCALAHADLPTTAPVALFSKPLGDNQLEMRQGWGRTFIMHQGHTIPVDHPKFTLFLVSRDGSERAVWERYASGFHGFKEARELNRVQMLDVIVEDDAVAVVFNQDGACWAYVERRGPDGQAVIVPFHEEFKRVPVKYGASFSRIPTLGVAARSASIKGSLRDSNLLIDLIDSEGKPLRYILKRVDGQTRWERVDQSAT